jgi:site-specific DNA-methyltransferase (adenine-specific)
MADGGVCVWVVGDQVIDGSESGSSFRQALCFMDNGFSLHDTMIYGKNGNPNSEATRYSQMFEYMFVFSKGKPKTFNPIKQSSLYYTGKQKYHTRRQRNGATKGGMYFINPDRNLDNIWIYDIGYMKSAKEDYIFDHPAIFPEQLALDHIISWSNPGDLILDPFMGSGTTAYCAKKLGRSYIGIEIEEKYCGIAKKRLAQSVMRLE